jgi:hypothetical protein
MNPVVERLLDQMRRNLAHAAELQRDRETAQAYVAMAANKLSQAVSMQYHVIPLVRSWG